MNMSIERSRYAASLGFTLLEMLIVLALLGMMLVVLTGTTFLGISARGRVTAVALDQQDFSSFRHILMIELGRSYPDWITADHYKKIDFDGGPDHIAFLGPALDVEGQGIAHYRLNIGNENGRSSILLQSFLSTLNPAPMLIASFAPGLASLKFKYFGLSRDGSSTLWQDDWTIRTIPPDLVSIQVTFPRGDHRSWPLLVIHPDIDADITCVIDAETHRCTGH